MVLDKAIGLQVWLFDMNAQMHGFTLIEIIVTTAIIGILAAIAIPSYTGYIDNSQNKNAILQVQAIQVCLERYFNDKFKYPESLSEVASCLPDSGLDPWGNAYEYLNIIDGDPGVKGDVRKDHALNPINSKYDLYSKGKNGVSKKQISQKDSEDDIILARDGAFIGLASDF